MDAAVAGATPHVQHATRGSVMVSDDDRGLQARRASARRTALIIAAIAVAFYFGFILMNHFAR